MIRHAGVKRQQSLFTTQAARKVAAAFHIYVLLKKIKEAPKTTQSSQSRWRPVLLTDESRFTLSTRDRRESGDAVENVTLPATSSSMAGLAVGQ